MANTGRGRVKKATDGRLKSNLPAERRSTKPKTRLQQLIDGELKVEDLDDEEIKRRRTRGPSGGFDGRPPAMLPRVLLSAMDVEFRRRIQKEFDEIADEAITALRTIMKDPRTQAQARVNAANIILERSVGKVPDQVIQDVLVREFEDFKGVLVEVSDEVVDELSERRKASGL